MTPTQRDVSSETPVCVLPPWLEYPFRLISWYDMNKFSAELFINIGSSLQWFGTLSDAGKWDEKTHQAAIKFGETIRSQLREIGCEIAARAAGRFGWQSFKPSDVEPLARELRNIIFDEMNQQLFLWVPQDRAKFYEYPQHVRDWDETQRAIEGPIAGRFKNAANEIYSARKCYALARWTACVFHLMRACEVGIKAIYKTLNIPPPRLADSWGNLLKPMDEQLQKKPSDRYGEWANHPGFFDHATNDVRAIKRAWRDTTMHVETNYDESGARKALDAVTSFFVHVSEKLDQDGNVHQQPLVYPLT